MGSLPGKFAAAHKEYKKKINTFGRNSYYLIPGFAIEDMEQELTEVLWSCCFDYHPRNGATFNTYFQTACHNRISTLSRAANTMKRKADVTSLDIDEVRAAIEDIFTDESPEAIVIRRMAVRQHFDDYGVAATKQQLRYSGFDSLLSETA